jgi:glucokinase
VTVVFDIGGTWFRSAVYDKSGTLQLAAKRPAYNYKSTPHADTLELQNKLVDYLLQQVDKYCSQKIDVRRAAISMGAALNGHTGEILNSGPLWGPNCKRFDLLGSLRERMPEVEWLVLNDVSAALLRYADMPQYHQYRRISLITVSSGIACRTYDCERKYIPLNKDGIQGEIGHIPIAFSLFGKSMEAACDCGGANHLNAFASGRGIERLLTNLTDVPLSRHNSSRFLDALRNQNDIHNLNSRFFNAVKSGDKLAGTLLDAVTLPIAQMIISMLTIDPEIDKVILTGGVVHSIEKQYLQSLLSNLSAIGMYQMSDQADFFANIIELGINDDNSGLLGAGATDASKNN